MAPLECMSRSEQDAIIFIVSGEIDLSNVQNLKEMIFHRLDEERKEVILDLSRVRYMDSSGIALLLTLARRLKPEGSVRLVSCPSAVRKMIFLIQLDRLIPVYDTVEEALGRGNALSLAS